jgi:hypothetical protein
VGLKEMRFQGVELINLGQDKIRFGNIRVRQRPFVLLALLYIIIVCERTSVSQEESPHVETVLFLCTPLRAYVGDEA